MHPLLRRSDAGDVAIRWPMLFWWVAIYIVTMLIVGLAFQQFVSDRFRATQIAFSAIAGILPSVLLLYIARRHAEGKSARQFSVTALLTCTAVACVLFALLGSQRRTDMEVFAKRQRLQDEITMIVGKGNVHVTGTTLVQVKRSSFDDHDLQKLLQRKRQLDEVDAPLTNLDLSDTNITDHGVGKLKIVDSLEYCFLERTGVTDTSIDTLSQLPNLRVASVASTAVTSERLLKLSIERPRLNIEPKTYLKLKSQ
jgi:hypothetical protein